MELEITRWFVNLADRTTSVVVKLVTSSALGDLTREDTVIIPKIESEPGIGWTLPTLQNEIVALVQLNRETKTATPDAVASAAKFTIPDNRPALVK